MNTRQPTSKNKQSPVEATTTLKQGEDNRLIVRQVQNQERTDICARWNSPTKVFPYTFLTREIPSVFSRRAKQARQLLCDLQNRLGLSK